MPAEVFAGDLGIIYGNVLCLPESIFGVEPGIAHHGVLCILKGVVALQVEAVDDDVLSVHKDVITVPGFYVAEPDVAAIPQGFSGVGQCYVFQREPVYLAEHFRGFYPGVEHPYVAGIPDSGTAVDGEETRFDQRVVVVPEGIFAHKFAFPGFDVATLFECRFAGVEFHMLQTEVMCGKQGSFSFKEGIADDFFSVFIFIVGSVSSGMNGIFLPGSCACFVAGLSLTPPCRGAPCPGISRACRVPGR